MLLQLFLLQHSDSKPRRGCRSSAGNSIHGWGLLPPALPAKKQKFKPCLSELFQQQLLRTGMKTLPSSCPRPGREGERP